MKRGAAAPSGEKKSPPSTETDSGSRRSPPSPDSSARQDGGAAAHTRPSPCTLAATLATPIRQRAAPGATSMKGPPLTVMAVPPSAGPAEGSSPVIFTVE